MAQASSIPQAARCRPSSSLAVAVSHTQVEGHKSVLFDGAQRSAALQAVVKARWTSLTGASEALTGKVSSSVAVTAKQVKRGPKPKGVIDDPQLKELIALPLPQLKLRCAEYPQIPSLFSLSKLEIARYLVAAMRGEPMPLLEGDVEYSDEKLAQLSDAELVKTIETAKTGVLWRICGRWKMPKLKTLPKAKMIEELKRRAVERKHKGLLVIETQPPKPTTAHSKRKKNLELLEKYRAEGEDQGPVTPTASSPSASRPARRRSKKARGEGGQGEAKEEAATPSATEPSRGGSEGNDSGPAKRQKTGTAIVQRMKEVVVLASADTHRGDADAGDTVRSLAAQVGSGISASALWHHTSALAAHAAACEESKEVVQWLRQYPIDDATNPALFAGAMTREESLRRVTQSSGPAAAASTRLTEVTAVLGHTPYERLSTGKCTVLLAVPGNLYRLDTLADALESLQCSRPSIELWWYCALVRHLTEVKWPAEGLQS